MAARKQKVVQIYASMRGLIAVEPGDDVKTELRAYAERNLKPKGYKITFKGEEMHATSPTGGKRVYTGVVCS